MKILLLTEKDVDQLLSIDEVMEAVESAFREKGLGRVQMPAKLYLSYCRYGGDLRTMPSYLEKLDISAVKVVNVHPENPKRYSLPTVMATIVMVNPKNGAPLAIMGGAKATSMRTAAAGGVAAKYLARKNPKVVALVGAGTQARTQLMALLFLYRKVEEVRVWSRTKKTVDAYVAEMKTVYGDSVKIVPVENVEKAVEKADIVVTTTPSRTPIVSDEWVKPGTHFNCIGADAPGKEELDPAILTRAKIIVDDWEQASHSGEINIPLAKGIITKQDVCGEIGDVIAGLKPGRTSSDEITVFTSTGLAIQDAVVGELAYKKALAKEVGQFFEIM